MDFYGTLGTACRTKESMAALFREGMTGARLNLSHVTLRECAPLLADFHSAARENACTPRLVIDLQGPELRIGRLAAPIQLEEGALVALAAETPLESEILIPERLFQAAAAGDSIALDDSAFLLKAEEKWGTRLYCRVLRGGLLRSRKSLAILDRVIDAPALTAEDRENLKNAGRFRVTDILQPFVRGREDIGALRDALRGEGLDGVRIMAKIENRQGLAALDEILAAADEICIARGDLGNGMPLWKLPGVQKEIARRCRAAGKPFCVATQLLWSMHERAVPTRAEVLDIYNAALDGAAGFMLTGETAVGAYPAEAMRYLVRTAREAEIWMDSRS